MCIEGNESDSVALTVVETQNQYSLDIPEFKVNNFITDCKNTEIKVNQFYKDKQTLVSVMAKYAISNDFNTYTKRSDKQRYEINYYLLFVDAVKDVLDL